MNVENTQMLSLAQKALGLVSVSLPHLSGLAHIVEISFAQQISTAGIFASGRLVINPDWFLTLNLQERVFVLAHELLHLALQTHERAVGSDPKLFNIAHDYIINDMLVKSLDQPVPAGGLEWEDASYLSAEVILQEIKKKQAGSQTISEHSWQKHSKKQPTEETNNSNSNLLDSNPLAKALKSALGKDSLKKNKILAHSSQPFEGHELDVLPDELEKEWFPSSDSSQLNSRKENIKKIAAEALSLGVWRETLENHFDQLLNYPSPGISPGEGRIMTEILKTSYRPPWELALQQWMENVAPGPRSYARASRRGGGRTDVVLAGRKREGWTIHIILDTSGSMSREFSRILGVIASFCESVNVGLVHVLQCDVEVTKDEMITPEELNNYFIDGLGGSDMSAAMLKLSEDPEVEAALVITDGCINYPEQPMPYNVLWVLTYEYSSFSPPYGQVIKLDGNNQE